MKRMCTMIGLFCAAGMGLVLNGHARAADPPSGQPEQVEFKFKFEPGRTIRQRLVTNAVGDLKILGPMKFQQRFEQVLVTRCRKVNADGSALLDLTLADVAIHQSMGPITIDFDSRTWKPGQAGNPQAAAIGKLFSAMAGVKFTLTVDASGEPLKVEGLNEAIQKALGQLGDDPESKAMRSMFEEMLSTLGDENITQQFRSFGRLAPPKPGPVKVGDKWDHTWSMKKFPMMASGMEGKGDYELLGIQTVNGRQCIKVRVRESFKMSPLDPQAAKEAQSNSPLGALLSRLKMELSSNGGDGIAYLDAQTGDVICMRQTQSIELKISAAADPKDPDEGTREGIQPMTMKFRVSVSLDLMDDAEGDGAKAETKPAANADKESEK